MIQMPHIDFSQRGDLSTDFPSFMEAMEAGYALFVFMKKPAKGSTTARLHYAYGTINPELIDPRQRPKGYGNGLHTAPPKPEGLHSYWDFCRYMDSARGNGWRAFYEDRWIGWFPEAYVTTDVLDEMPWL